MKNKTEQNKNKQYQESYIFQSQDALANPIRRGLSTSRHANGKFTDVSADARNYVFADLCGSMALTMTILSSINGQANEKTDVN